MNDKVNILGVDYKIKGMTEEENPKFKECNGYVDFTTKEIFVCVFEPDEKTFQNAEYFIKTALRHEIVHAALYESGLDTSSLEYSNWARNEEMVDWIAIQTPKLIKMFEEADAL